jgi:hypothetical protein
MLVYNKSEQIIMADKAKETNKKQESAPKEVVKSQPKKEEVKNITAEDIKNNPAIQRITENGKIVAEEKLPETDVVYFLARKDGAWSIVAGYGVNGVMYAESEPIKNDPELMRQQNVPSQSLDRTGQANIQYTVNWMAGKVRQEIAFKLGKQSGPAITFVN